MTNAQTTLEHAETQKRAHACKVAMVASFTVGLVELVLGVVFGMASLRAEGIHTLLDGLDSIIVLISVYVAARPADRTHPYGHGKFEALGASVEGAFIVAAALGIGYDAIARLVRGDVPERIPLLTVGVMAAASLLYLFISAYLMRIARETKSPAVLAEALHLRTHIYITGGVAGGLLVGYFGQYPIVDTLLALGIAFCLILIAGHVFKESFSQFTDAALPPDEVHEMAGIVETFSDRFVEVHGVRTRRSGAERHIEMHLVVLPDTTVSTAHALSHQIENAISLKWPTTRTTIHIEPLNTADTAHTRWIEGQPKVRTDDDTPNDREFIH